MISRIGVFQQSVDTVHKHHPRRHQHITQAVALVVLIGITAAAVIPLQRKLEQRMEELKDDVIAILEQFTGREITFSRFSPSVLRYIEIRDMKIHSVDDPESALLSVNRVRIYFSLIALLRGFREQALRRISVEDTTFTADLDRDQDLLDLVRDLTRAPREGPGPEIPWKLASVAGITDLTISGKNLSILVISGENRIRASRLFFEIETGDQSYTLDLSTDFQASFDPVGPIESISASIALDTTLSFGFDVINGALALSNLDTEAFGITDQTFQIRMREGVWTLRKIQDRLPIDLEVAYRANEQALSLSLSTDGFTPLSLFTPKGKLQEIAPFLEIETSGTGYFEVGLADSKLEYGGDLVTRVPYDFLPETLVVHSVFDGTESMIRIETLDVASSFGTLSYTGSLAFGTIQPVGTIEMIDFNWPLGRPITTRGTFAYRDGEISLEAASVEFDGEELRDLSVLVRQREQGADFTATLSVAHTNDLSVEGTVLFAEERSLDLAAYLVSIPIDKLHTLIGGSHAQLPLERYIGTTTIDASVFIQSDFDRFSFSVPGFRALNTENDYEMTIIASGNSDEVRVTKVDARLGEEHAEASLVLRLEGDGLASYDGRATYREQSYRFTGEYDRETGFFLTGDYGLNAAFLTSDQRLQFRFACTGLPVALPDGVIVATMQTAGTFDAPDAWEVQIMRLILEDLPLLPTQRIDLAGVGTLSDRTMAFTELTLSDQFSTVTGRIDLQYTLNGSPSVSGTVEASNRSSGEEYAVAGSYNDGTIRLDFRFSESPIARFGELPLKGNASGTGTVSGSLDAPDIAASITVKDGRFNEGSIGLKGTIVLNNRRLTAEDLTIDLKSSRLRGGVIELDFADSSFFARAEYSGIFEAKPISATFEADGRFDSAIGRRNIDRALDSDFRALVAIRSVMYGEPDRSDWAFTVHRSGEQIAVSGGIAQAVEAVINLDGSFALLLGEPLPVKMSATGKIWDNEIEAVLSAVRIDMEGVESVVTIPFFNITSGIASSGSNQLRIVGRINDPDIYGELAASNLLARVDVIPEAIGPFDARLSFQGKKLVIDNALLPIGAGAARGYVDFTLDHWLPGAYEIEIVTDPTNRNGLHVNYNFGSIKVDGYANGVLTVTGDEIATILDGDLSIRNTNIQLGDPLPPEEDTGGPGLIVDIRFTTDRQVTFHWPSENLPVLRSNAATGQLIRLRSNSLDGSLGIDGDVAVRGGDIFYFKRSFYIREGQIRFRENEDRFDPFITMRAETKDRTDDGKDLTLYLIVENQKLSQFSPRFESSPPMASIDILTRLGRSIVQDASGDPSLSSAVLATTDILGQFAIFRSVEQQIRNMLQLDLFSLRTQIIQNILSENVFPTGADPISGQTSIGRYLDNTTLFLGKYFGNDLFVEAMFRLKSNRALLTSANANDDLFIDSEIRLEWRTPLFLLEFSMLPNLTDPLSSITRSSIGLSWDF